MTNQLTTGFLQDAQETFTHGPFTILIVADNNPQSVNGGVIIGH